MGFQELRWICGKEGNRSRCGEREAKSGSVGRVAGRRVGPQRPLSPGGRRCRAPGHLSPRRMSGLKARLQGRWPWTPAETGFSTRRPGEPGRGGQMGHPGRGRGRARRAEGPGQGQGALGGDPPRETGAQSSTGSHSLTVFGRFSKSAAFPSPLPGFTSLWNTFHAPPHILDLWRVVSIHQNVCAPRTKFLFCLRLCCLT